MFCEIGNFDTKNYNLSHKICNKTLKSVTCQTDVTLSKTNNALFSVVTLFKEYCYIFLRSIQLVAPYLQNDCMYESNILVYNILPQSHIKCPTFLFWKSQNKCQVSQTCGVH